MKNYFPKLFIFSFLFFVVIADVHYYTYFDSGKKGAGANEMKFREFSNSKRDDYGDLGQYKTSNYDEDKKKLRIQKSENKIENTLKDQDKIGTELQYSKIKDVLGILIKKRQAIKVAITRSSYKKLRDGEINELKNIRQFFEKYYRKVERLMSDIEKENTKSGYNSHEFAEAKKALSEISENVNSIKIRIEAMDKDGEKNRAGAISDINGSYNYEGYKNLNLARVVIDWVDELASSKNIELFL
ncbi:hypothetical protein AYI70_g1286 [Smittium culicis]|uniref:Uncharacterized protein n=1 Tax=Smittium culicis TaxID=133412 RepID=A0A1R1YD81_9FUNG|nr:hypothetical protein AYI70_g1286 [Smittium culicis]